MGVFVAIGLGVRVDMQMRSDIRVIVAVYVNSLPDDSSYHIRSKQDEHQPNGEFKNKCQVSWNHET